MLTNVRWNLVSRAGTAFEAVVGSLKVHIFNKTWRALSFWHVRGEINYNLHVACPVWPMRTSYIVFYKQKVHLYIHIVFFPVLIFLILIILKKNIILLLCNLKLNQYIFIKIGKKRFRVVFLKLKLALQVCEGSATDSECSSIEKSRRQRLMFFMD